MERSDSERSSDETACGACPGIVDLEHLNLGIPPRGDAERARRQEVEVHVGRCSHCRARLDEMHEASDFIASFRWGGDGGRERLDLWGADDPQSDAPEIDHPVGSERNDSLPRRDPVSLAPAGLRDDIVGYAVQSILDVGGQGVVYRARQRTTGRIVAIKLPHGDAARHPARRYRLRREIELLARLDHPGIVRVYGDCRTREGEIGCVMELVCGIRFDAWAAARRAEGGESTGRRRIVEAVARMAEAVGYAHRNGVLHRDLTPRNVIVTDEGLPRVLDFGLAKAIESGAGSFETMTGAFIGTLTYAAPEQLESSDRPAGERGDVRSDVHGLGLLLYVALAGTLPWPTDASPDALVRFIREEARERPTARRSVPARSPGLTSDVGSDQGSDLGSAPATTPAPAPLPDRELDAITLMAVAIEPERRYQSAQELADDLHRWLDGAPVRARFDSRWYVIRKTLWRNRLPAAIVATLLGVATVLGSLALQSARTERRASLDRERAEEESLRVRAIAELFQAVTPASTEDRDDALVWRMLDGFEGVGTRLKFGFYSDDPAFESMLRMTLASLVAGDPALAGEGEIYARDGLRSRLERFGAEHPETAAGHHDLAHVLLTRRRSSEALEEARRAVDLRLRHLGSSDRLTLESEELLARAQLHCGRFEEADATIAIARGAYTRSIHGVELGVALGLAESEIAEAVGDAARAWTSSDAALRLALAGLHDDHPGLSRAIGRVGSLARTREEPVREIVVALEVESPTEVASAMTALAEALDRTATHAIGERPDRLAPLASLLALRRAALGDRHLAVGRSLASLGVELNRHHRFEEAEAALAEGCAILVEHRGPDDLASRNCRTNWEATLVNLGRFAEAADATRAHLARLEAAPSASHDPFGIALAYSYLVRYELFADQFEQAERTSRDALDRIEQVFGENHHAFGLVLTCRAVALGELERGDEAVEAARRGLAIVEDSVATPPDQMLAARCFAGTALCLAGHDREGADLIEPALISILRGGHHSTLDFFLAPLVEARRRVDGEEAAARAAALPQTVERRPYGMRIRPEDVPPRGENVR